MTTFGDYELDDVYDTAPPAVEQVAYRIHRLVRYLAQLAGEDPGDFFDLTRRQQDDALRVAELVVDWVADHPPTERADLARAIHDARRDVEVLPRWPDLPSDLRGVGEAIARAVAEWLIRQGAWR